MLLALSARRGALALVLTCGFALSGCSQTDTGAAAAQPQRPGPNGDGRSNQPPVPVAVIPAITGSIAATYTATATLQPNAQADVLARVSGVVERIEREVGDWVDRDGVLLQIDNDAYRVRVQQAQARTANLRSRFERR
jgi:membrane fusion protein, multidrug efflux system